MSAPQPPAAAATATAAVTAAAAEPAAPAMTTPAAGREPPMPAPPPPPGMVVPPVLDLPYAVDELAKDRTADPDRWGGKPGRAKDAASVGQPAPAPKTDADGKLKMPKQRKKPARNFKCRFCPKAYSTANDLQGHENTHLPKEEQQTWDCVICGKQFTRRGTLRQHMPIHETDDSKKRPYKCLHPGCGKAFSHPGTLRKHMATHLPKSLKCPFDGCDKMFRLQQHLNKHMESHTNPKPKKVGDGKYLTSKGQLAKVPAPPDDATAAKKPRPPKRSGKTVGTSADLKAAAPPAVSAVAAAWSGLLPATCPTAPKQVADSAGDSAPRPTATREAAVAAAAAAALGPNPGTVAQAVAPPPPGPPGTTAQPVVPAAVTAPAAAVAVARAVVAAPAGTSKNGKPTAGKATKTGKVGNGKVSKAVTDMAQLLAVVGEEKKTA